MRSGYAQFGSTVLYPETSLLQSARIFLYVNMPRVDEGPSAAEGSSKQDSAWDWMAK